MKLFNRCLIYLLLLLPLHSLAHGYWLEVSGTHKVNEAATVRLFYGDCAAGEKLKGSFLDKMKDIQVFVTINGRKGAVVMKQFDEYWEGSFIPAFEGLYEVTGLNDVRDVQDWTKHQLGIVRPVQYLRASYAAGKANAQSINAYALDAVVKKQDGQYNIGIYNDGKLFSEASCTLGSFGHPDKKIGINKAGTTSLGSLAAGQYILSVEWIDKTPGEFNGKAYASVRHRLDYTLVVE